MPKLSILLPTFNGAEFLGSAVRSVLAQSYENWELLILDDGSTDGTADLARSFSAQDPRIRHLPNDTNLGIQKTLNRGLQAAQGEFIARIDDDDEWIDARKLDLQMEIMESRPDILLVGTGVVVVNEKGIELMRYLLPSSDDEIRSRLLGKNCFVHSSVVFRKDAALRFGGYDETADTRHVEDYDLWLKLGTVGKLANLPLFAVKFRLRPGNISSRNKMYQFRRDLELTRRFQGAYPGYFPALLRGYARILFYGFFNLVPFAAFKNRVLKFYKES